MSDGVKLKEKREKMLAVAKRKEINCPLTLVWFKIVKYASLVLAAIGAFGLLFVMLNISSTLNNPNFAEKISENFYNAFVMYCVMSVVLILLDIGVCVWRYIILTYLPTNGYIQLIIGFVMGVAISAISSGLSAYINDELAMEVYGRDENTIMAAVVASLIRTGFYFIINFIYFRKRRDVFDEVIDYEKVSSECIGSIDICPHCDAAVPNGQMFCDKCGKNIDYEN